MFSSIERPVEWLSLCGEMGWNVTEFFVLCPSVGEYMPSGSQSFSYSSGSIYINLHDGLSSLGFMFGTGFGGNPTTETIMMV